MTSEEAAGAIASGRYLALAADEAVLRRLPAGNWIGGTIPYFLSEQGGLQSREQVMVTELAEAGRQAQIVDYTSATLPDIAADAPENGFTLLIIPGMSPLHSQYAADAQEYAEMFLKPIVGWISGVHLDDLGRITPKVINGRTGVISDAQAVAIHVPLPAGRLAVVGILNLFKQGAGDRITFPESGFSATDCRVNGEPANFAQYAAAKGLDLSLPLVADYHGAQINVSFKGVDAGQGRVEFYAPVFSGIEYRQAGPVGDYASGFRDLVAGLEVHPRFSCNCILNYLYGKLEGRPAGGFAGPVTFGEIGYQLLNQTMVYLQEVEQ
jgi:hypothetical protein